jgi:hypothetical protein
MVVCGENILKIRLSHPLRDEDLITCNKQIDLPPLTCRGALYGYPRVKELVILITAARYILFNPRS